MRFEEKMHSLLLARAIIFLRSLNISAGLFAVSRVLKMPSSMELVLGLAGVFVVCVVAQLAFYAMQKSVVFAAKEVYINLAVLAGLLIMGLLFGR